MKSNELLSSTGETFEYARLYIEQQIDLLKLESAEKIAITTSNLITVGVVFLLGVLILIFLSLSLGFFLGSFLGSYSLAFLVIAGLYILITSIVILFKKTIITNPVLTIVIKNILD